VVLGVLLLAAAALKLGGRDVSAVPQVGWLSAPWVQVAAAEWEIVLGLWLLSGAYRRWAWRTAVGTFVLFAAVSGYLGWQGVANCGCFGAVKASPWWAFGVDIAALMLLIVGRPRAAESAALPQGLLAAGATAVVLLGLLAAAGTAAYGSPEAAVARLRGDPLLVTPGYLHFGDGPAGETLASEVRVSNLTDRPVRLIGGTSDCSCATTASLPLTLPPHGEEVVAVRLKLPATAGTFTRTAELWTDCEAQRTVRLQFGGRVVE
jgi:hypothetical protein